MSEQSFSSQAGAKAEGDAPSVGVGMLGYAFMGKAHSNAYKTLPYMMYPPAAIPELVAISGRNEEAVSEAARRFGYQKYYTDYRDMLNDPDVILFDNGGPNNIHAEANIAAAEAGKHILSEKPLGRNPEESKAMLDAVEKADVKHMVAFNYRFVPAIRLVRNLIDAGKLGRIYHFRAQYLQQWIMPHFGTPYIWRLDKEVAGSGALGDLGTHIIDLAHYLCGDFASVAGKATTFITERPDDNGEMRKIDVDDAFVAAVEFTNGAIGTIEATRFAGGRQNYNNFEINGEKGSIRFNLERMNELEVWWVDDDQDTAGFHQVNVSEAFHPYWENWWPQGHIIGWEHTFVHEIDHFLRAIVNGDDVAPYGATFLDGYKADVVAAAIIESSENKTHVDINY